MLQSVDTEGRKVLGDMRNDVFKKIEKGLFT